MIKNYLKVAVRNILRYKGYSLINIAGLATGMASAILILLWVVDEYSFDRFHQNAPNLYRIVTEAQYSAEVREFAWTPAPLASAMEEDFPEIEQTARFGYGGQSLTTYQDKRFYEDGIRFVDPAFWEMFTFPFVLGSPETSASNIYSVVVTEEIAEKYFGNQNPLGKALNIQGEDFTVTGVIENIPGNSHIQFDIVVPFEYLIAAGGPTHWGGHSYRTFVQLRSGASYLSLNELLVKWTEEHSNEPVTYYLQPLTDIHLKYESAETYVLIFSSIAAFVLLIACINFMNLSTARSCNRSLEVGLRKVIGAQRVDIVRQFFGESILVAVFAFMLALLLTELLLPTFNHISGKQLDFKYLGNLPVLLGLVGIVLVVGIVSGSYPALYLSAFRPVQVLKSKLELGSGKSWFRRTLVVLQFTISIVLIISTLVVHKQMSYTQNKDLGFDKDYMLSLPIRGDLAQKYQAFKDDLLQIPSIVGVTAGSGMPGGNIGSEWGQINWEGKDPDQVVPMYHYSVAHDYLETFGMEIVEGRNFSATMATDTMNFILNQAAVKATGMDSPVGKEFYLLHRTGEIIGMVEDFHTFSMRSEINPVIIRMMPPNYWNYIFVRLDRNHPDVTATLEKLKQKWNNYLPEYPFEYEFLDTTLQDWYQREKRMGTIFNYFTGLAIFICCLGLLGLASFMAERRTKEIGIRKVLGATVTSIVRLLSKEFVILVVVANVAAIPIAFYLMNRWLENFAFRTNISWDIFIVAGILAMAIAVITVSFQAIKAATANPVNSLRYE